MTDSDAHPDAANAQRDAVKWSLISVLFSTQPLSAATARVLFDAAWELYRADLGSGPINAPLMQGRIENLRKDMLLGTVGGPSFEAVFDSERGTATVRFLITRRGLEWMAEQQPSDAFN
jgi:hypothetical protein